MKMRFTALAVFLTLFVSLKAQQPAIINGGFENWVDSVPSYPVGWDNDDHLLHTESTLITQKGWCIKDTTPGNFVAGTASCRLKTDTVNLLNRLIPGAVSYGKLAFGGGAPYPIGVAFTGRPLVFSGSVKYIPNGTDTAQYQVFLSRWDSTADTVIKVVLDRYLVTSTDSNFVNFSDTLQYLSSLNPDTVYIAFLSGLGNSYSKPGSLLWVDNLAFEYLNTGVVHLDMDDAVKVYPNPANDQLTVTTDSYMAGYGFNIYDVNGRRIKTFTLTAATSTFDITPLANGNYIYTITDKTGKQIHQSKLAVVK